MKKEMIKGTCGIMKVISMMLIMAMMLCVLASCAQGETGPKGDTGDESDVNIFGKWQVTKEPTCTEPGEETRVCINDSSKTEKREIPAKGHTEVIDQAVEATCMILGKTEGKHCSVCGTVIVKQEEIPVKGHTEVIDLAVAATCTTSGKTEGKHCSVCGTVIVKQEEIPAKKHTYENGKCTVCGESRPASEGLEYTLNRDGKSYSVTGIGTCKDKDVVIPDTYNDLPVTSIGNSAFWGCSSLTSILIPDRVTSIGSRAFSECSSLTSAVISDSVTNIGRGAFDGCSSLTSIVIPDSVTSIDARAFFCCISLTSIVIPNSVKSIGDDAFSGCINLESITVSSGNTKYHSAGNCLIDTANKTLILGCRTSIIPMDGSVTSMGDDAFFGCSSLTSIVIPNNVTSIGEYAFFGCSSLTSIVIPDRVTSIGEGAFEYCSSLESITVSSGNKKYHSAGNCLIDTANKTLIAGCKNSIIPTDGSVTSIGEGAFEYCSSLTSIVIPDSVTKIGGLAFWECSSLTSAVIGNSVTSIGDSAFNGCSSLTSIVIPGSVKSIGDGAFWECISLTSIRYNGTKAQWQKISKAFNWDFFTGNYTVYCTDGTLSK